jgi:hypothetical protein
MLLALSFLISALISTAILGATLHILSGESDNPFQVDGRAATWAKCLGLVVIVNLLSLIPNVGGAVLTLGAWFGGIMLLFGRTLGHTVLLTCCNSALAFFVWWLLAKVM